METNRPTLDIEGLKNRIHDYIAKRLEGAETEHLRIDDIKLDNPFIIVSVEFQAHIDLK